MLDRWTVLATMDTTVCTAYVDFNVPGKANAPPIGLKATVWELSRSLPTGTVEKYAIEFTDVSGRLSPITVPVTTYVQVDRPTGDDNISPETVPPFNSNNIHGAVLSVCIIHAMSCEVCMKAIGERCMIECVPDVVRS